MVKNSGLAPIIPVLPPRHHLPAHADVMFYPNEHEILFYELFDGKLLRRMRRPEVATRAADVGTATNVSGKGQRNTKDRITSLAWKAHDLELYSAHADGSICAWKPRTHEDIEADEDERLEVEEKDESRKRKRGVLDDIYAGLTKKNITFGNMGL
jgi:DNA excision repair protein ERCC-8